MAGVESIVSANGSQGVTGNNRYEQPAEEPLKAKLKKTPLFDFAAQHPNIQTSGASIW